MQPLRCPYWGNNTALRASLGVHYNWNIYVYGSHFTLEIFDMQTVVSLVISGGVWPSAPVQSQGPEDHTEDGVAGGQQPGGGGGGQQQSQVWPGLSLEKLVKKNTPT